MKGKEGRKEEMREGRESGRKGGREGGREGGRKEGRTVNLVPLKSHVQVASENKKGILKQLFLTTETTQ